MFQVNLSLRIKREGQCVLYLCLSVFLSVCYVMGVPTAAPIVTKLGGQTLRFTRLPVMGVKCEFQGRLEAQVEVQILPFLFKSSTPTPNRAKMAIP